MPATSCNTEGNMQAVRCPRCNLLVGPGHYAPANADGTGKPLASSSQVHYPVEVEGFALPAETLNNEACDGSELLGYLEPC